MSLNKTTENLTGTFDRDDTCTRQVWVNGILGLEIHKMALPFVRQGNGKPANLVAWGTFPDIEEESIAA
jgi:hypothetical protein